LAKVGIVALLAAMLAIPAALYVIPVVQAAGTYSAWLKIVTPSWNGIPCLSAPVTSTPPMRACVDNTNPVTGFADRYNLTGRWYFVEVYHERGAPFNDVVRYPQTFYPNGTGFVQIRWPDDWANLTVVVKAKSYDGIEIGAGSLYSGIIVYMLVVNASPTYMNAKFGPPILAASTTRRNATILLDGSRYDVPYGQSWAALLGQSGSRAGPVDFLALFPNQFKDAFSDPRNAWVANASVIFTPFHVHTWYSVKDNLSYAQVKIYFLNRTDPNSKGIAPGADEKAELLRAFVTKDDGSGYGLYDPRTTGEMYPAHGRYEKNELIPIPLTAVNWNTTIPYRDPLRAHLNVTVRVWWETVLVNTTFFMGRDPTGFATLDDTHVRDPTPLYALRDGIPFNDFFVTGRPYLEALNLNYNYTTVPYVTGGHTDRLAIFLNSTVFYWRCGVRDDDLDVNGTVSDPTTFGWGFRAFNSSLFLAKCKFNLRDKNNNAYYLQNQVGTTERPFSIPGDGYALTSNPHAWPGYLPQFREYLRVPNATLWSSLAAKFAAVDIFIGTSRRKASLEVYTSRYYTGTDDLITNDPSKVAIDDKLRTLTIFDDEGPYNGLRIEVQYSGGFMDSYGGASQTVGVFTLRNPYLIALKNETAWPNPWAVGPGPLYPEIYSTAPRRVKLGTSSSGADITGRVADNYRYVDDPFVGPYAFYNDSKLLLVANVSDIVFTFKDSEGNVLDPSDVEVFLIRETGTPVRLQAYRLVAEVNGRLDYELVGPVTWPFLRWVNISATLLGSQAPTYVWVAFQVPEDLMYGIRVKFAGVTVYENDGLIPKLVKTEFKPVTLNIFKLKVLFVDCQDRALAQTPAYMIDPATNSEVRFNTGTDGAKDFIVTGGTLTFTRLYWKGVDVPFLEAILPNGTRIPATDGKVSITVSGDYHAPIKVKALIEDFKFKTYDFQGTFAIPRLNITVSWVGYNISDPLRRPWYFLETMDPRPYAIPDGTLAERLGVVPAGQGAAFDAQRWNTSVRVAQFFSYVIRHDNATNEYIFYQMPPAIYNITVTTVVPTGAAQSASPGYGFWPGETGDRPYESTIVWIPGSSSVLPRESHAGARTRVVLREFNVDLRFTQCGVVNVDLRTWALHWYLEMINGDLKIGDVSFDIINDNFVSMTLGLRNSTRWDRLTLEYKSVLYGNNFRPGPQDYSYLWWNGSYRLVEVRLTTNMSFTVDKFYNKTALPNKVWHALNFTLQPSLTLFQQQRTYSKWVSLNASFGYKITIYDKDTLRAPLPVTFVKPKAIDKGGAPLENALIEAWILALNTTDGAKLRIDTADTGSGTVGNLSVTWTWEKKRVADPDAPQRFKLVRWDRVYLTLTAPAPPPPSGTIVTYSAGDDFNTLGIGAGTIIRFTTPASILIAPGQTLTLRFHTSGTVTISTFISTVITVNPGDIITFSGGAFFPGAIITIPPSMIVTVVDVSNPIAISFTTPGILEILPSIAPTAPESKTILVQVPPYPAKLYLRNVIGDYDLVVTAREVILLIDNATARDNNVGEDTPMGTPDGLLMYARWYTNSDGLIKSFTKPGYEGLLLLPTSGWLNDTFHDNNPKSKDEFHYQFNVVWKSAVVYSDNFVLDKELVEFGASEVYDVRFMFTLSNSTDPAHAVRNLNLWIYYPNVTTWWSNNLWNATLPVVYDPPVGSNLPAPQDYRACSDSVFRCALRVTLISSADADGVVEFSKIPGPRFMNTTWKYVFSANHSDVTWLKDLVATQFVLNNETFGDGKLKEVTKSSIDVPIMLNAAKQVSVVLLTWRDEQGVPTAYPIQGYTVKLQARRLGTPVDTGVLTAVSDALGFATFNSDPTDVRKVFWAGLTIRYRVEPPAYVNEPDDTKWRDWMRNLNVQLVEQAYNTPTRRSSFAYFPDEEPTHWAITTISTTFDPDGFCIGLCTYFDKDQGRTISKPFAITVNYAAVTVRAIDFNGRPLAGAFVELVDRASGRIAGWSYTANNSWTARPIDIQELFMFHRGKLLDPRPIGGAGYTAIMNLTFGKWNYDANNDDVVDASGVRNPLQLIIRVYWLANDPTPNNAVGNLWPVWPFRDETAPLPRHVKVYDSDFDETDAAAKTLVVPHSEAAFGLRLPDRTISASDPVSRGVHRDVTTAVFDFKALLNYGGKTLPDEILKRLEVFVYKKVGATTELSLRFTEGVGMTKGTFTINRLPRGVYELEVRFGPAGTIFKRTFDISTVNVGTVQVEASLPFTDLSFEVTDLKGRPLTIAPGDVSIEPATYYFRREVAGNVITITALYTGAPVTITVKYSSPTYGTSVQVTLTDTAEGIRTRLIGGRTLQLPVDDVVITAVDAQGRPVGGAVVTFKGVTKTTGSDGKAVFERVPLGTEDAPIAYNVRVSVEGVEVYNKDEPISVARKEISVLAQLFALTVRVVGDLGQGLQGASVQLLRAGTTVATGSADSAGAVRFERLAPASYEVRAQYKGFSGTATVSLDALRRGEVVEIRLPVYVEVLGIPMSLATLLALVIGIILLVIVLAIIISEYRWWRGRRLGVYAPPPPKAPAK
jgi:hypothetical protein